MTCRRNFVCDSDAGHILGSAIVEMHRGQRDARRSRAIRLPISLLRNQLIGGCDVLITESTYGNRLHPPTGDLKRNFEGLNEAVKQRVIIRVQSRESERRLLLK
jgi:metallo-beta-lactamase family protein